ncbi:zinc ribbon domain-containing protein [Leptospira interrogans]|uniref:Zinc ribbon domain protein n=5 Tax=Leptospira interrogans TaxID=173 RepID=A0A0E2D9Z0_LEPIR|nr:MULTISPECIES: FmdB family zinc ribbon protein [Leptospira]EMF44826.1 zinc ribbon domain protein [Leptospira interrogans serovar Lora str. TE 1992]KAA1287628.1 FmdB family transcriptional regulator [Leptospira interrogans serovar Geyaweera]AKH76426.1 FmdB family transcriptional regulator [Leptospira interrogans serovar Bratislava]AKP26745.1 FmdB family transcriptional regulator [Leptospira interrogans serovar Manilae]AKP30523.1 FmdB family transcriptional regulator [Leptospira interrogans se
MPTYDYKCKACGQIFEQFHSMKDDPIKDCHLCGKKGEVERMISNGSGIIFKGTGFYVTDYKKSGSGESSSTTSPATSSSD